MSTSPSPIGPTLRPDFCRDLLHRLYTTISEAVVIEGPDLTAGIDPTINAPVLVSANLSGSEPDWKIVGGVEREK